MPFNLYKILQIDNELEYYEPKTIVLGGGGLIQTTARKQNPALSGGWTISASDMITTAGVDAETHALVIDTSPKYLTINLYQIRSISGFTYNTWTPIIINFEQLFADEEVDLQDNDTPAESVAEFKSRFRDKSCTRSKIRTFLYLGGGSESGSWNWGGNSRTTAALLREDAWSYFMKISA